ncbi:unnamed protein product [Symbiodinium microadriaticum]|nr:unnamed protein product [Symbiodinium microadriaticum]
MCHWTNGRLRHDSAHLAHARRVEYPGDLFDTTTDFGSYYPWDEAAWGPLDNGASGSGDTGRRVAVPQRDLEELQADFRQLVDQGAGAAGGVPVCWDLLPLEAHRYPVDEEEWVRRAHDLLCRYAPRREPGTGRADPAPPGQGCILQAAHVWRDGTWSSVEDLLRMGRFDLVPPNVALASFRSSEVVEDKPDEPDVSSLFQATRPLARTWEELMDVFWGWFEEGRQVGLAAQMVRRFMQDRDSEGYMEWSQPAVAALAAGIPVSSGVAYDCHLPTSTCGPRRLRISSTKHFSKVAREARPTTGRAQTTRWKMNSWTLWNEVAVEVKDRDEATEATDPAPTVHHTGICWVWIQRHCQVVPDSRASYIRTVLAGFSAQQQALMTLGLLTAFRAMMSELGVVLHAASFVEVVPEGAAAGEEEDEEDEDEDGIPTLMLQMDTQLLDDVGLSLVQRDASEIAGALGRLQDALAGESAPARGYQALEDQVAEWSWSWWRVLEPMLLNQPDDPPNAQDTFAVSSSGDGSLQTRTMEMQEVDVDQLAADQEVERRDAEALLHQQALYEHEEENYYRGVEAVVEAEISAQAARDARSWDDWAFHDEMYAGRERGSVSASKFQWVQGEDNRGAMTVEVPEASEEPVPSEVSTVPALLDQAPEHHADRLPVLEPTNGGGAVAVQQGQSQQLAAERGCEVPMEFEDFQQMEIGEYD